MSDLFMRRSAIISICELFRYELRRVWNTSLTLLVVSIMNPRWADDEKEDMMLLMLIHFATFWGYGACSSSVSTHISLRRPKRVSAGITRSGVTCVA